MKRLQTSLLAVFLSLSICACTTTQLSADIDVPTRAKLAQISVNADGSDFRYWNKNSPSFQKLTAYVKEVTNPASSSFIPVEDRIAVFDLDGTLICETTPSYFEWMLYLERVLNDAAYKPSPNEKAYAQMVKAGIYHIGIPNPVAGTGLEASPNGAGLSAPKSLPKDISREQARAQEAAFSGMSIADYDAYVKRFMQTPAEGMNNLARGDSFYLPMVEVLSYLSANRFKLFIVSGSDRQTVRILARGALPVDSDNIIGTDARQYASHQGTTDGLDYRHTGDDVILRGEFIEKNLQMNKVSSISREIGKQPVLAFGNSSGDYSMFSYTVSNNKYKALAFALLCDDTERELGNPGKASKVRAACEANGWIPISMKNDFRLIYGRNVKRADKY
ncbi:MAG: haloacid dehalogenase-like hydrolase [Duodenibacillus sp.]|nr:haloacid dehalogenase-like hydrolase [Succinivibrionaceae bacterium]MBQ9240700.1 haloacid dehalogenase-like hydrolase [Duodenibacillus sp.]